QCEPGFLPRFADRDRRLRLSAVDETGGRLELPRRAAGEQRRETELLDKHDALPVGVVEHDRSRLPAAQCVVIAQGTPPAGKQAMPETENIHPEKSLEGLCRLDDLDIGMRRQPPAHADAPAAAAGSAACRPRGSRIVNSVNSPGRLSAVIVPPCCWVTMS